MKDITLLTLLIFFFIFQSYSQTVNLAVFDEHDNTITNYQLFINKKQKHITNNETSSIYFTTQPKDIIEIQHPFYKKYRFTIPETVKTSDTLQRIVVLKANYQLYDEIRITGSKYKEVFDEKNEFIIDYYLHPKEKQIILSKQGGVIFLKLREQEKTIDSILLNDRAEKLFMDALSNFFLIEKNVAKQFNVVADKLVLCDTISLTVFNKEIKNMVVAEKDYGIYEKFSMHNQLYNLHEISDGKSKIIFNFFETDKYKRAVHYYWQVVSYYNANIEVKDNIILMGIWDGDLMTLNLYDKEINRMTSWSDKITSKKLNIHSYGMMNNLIVLNGENDSIVHINYQNLEISKEVPSQQKLTGNYFFDYFYDNIYMIDNSKGTTQVYKMNLETGKAKLMADLSDIKQPRNIKIINDKVYFLIMEQNGFNRLMKVN